MLRRLAIALLLSLPWGPALAVDEAGRSAGRDAIARQIAAFRRDDAAAAFGFASPGIRALFGTEDAFIGAVRRAYAPVYRPRDFAFGPVRDAGDGFEQAVAITDEAGQDWDAVYTLERQPDGSWLIAGCRLVKRPGESA